MGCSFGLCFFVSDLWAGWHSLNGMGLMSCGKGIGARSPICFSAPAGQGGDDVEKTSVRIRVAGSRRFGWEPWCHPTWRCQPCTVSATKRDLLTTFSYHSLRQPRKSRAQHWEALLPIEGNPRT